MKFLSKNAKEIFLVPQKKLVDIMIELAFEKYYKNSRYKISRNMNRDNSNNHNKTYDPKWDDFILKNNGSFLQSLEWEIIQKNFGRKCWKIKVKEAARKEVALEALVVQHTLPLKKNYLYVPFGPVIKDQNYQKSIFCEFLSESEKIAKKEKSIFLKIDAKEKKKISDFGFIKSKKEIQPKNTIVLNLKESEENLLKNMKQKTRYNIRLANKQKIWLKEAGDGDFERFWEILKETSNRGGFFRHDKNYYKKLLETKSGCFENKLFLAEYEGRVLAGAIVNFFGNTATYLHGASSNKARNLMAPYFLHWEIIKKAKEAGFEKYDFWGISKKYPGTSKFKEGFGGKIVEHGGAYDLVYDKLWYWIYNVARKIITDIYAKYANK